MLVICFLLVIITASMLYLITVTERNKLSTLLTIDNDHMFNQVFKRPFGPAGYYALGILFSIFYFEYS